MQMCSVNFFSILTTRGGCLLYRVNHNLVIFSEAINTRTFRLGILTQFGMQITWVNSFLNFDHQGEVFTPQGKSRLSHFLGDYERQNLQILVINIVWHVDWLYKLNFQSLQILVNNIVWHVNWLYKLNFKFLTTRGRCLLHKVNHNLAIFSEAINSRAFKLVGIMQFVMYMCR